jgi:MoaA/NifB/PqqE/SkfB family radical SAM enzyme
MIIYKKVFTGSACGNNCLYCEHQGQKREERPLSEIKAELEMQHSSGEESGCESIELVGGEPATRSDLLQVVSYARNQGWRRTKMRTNGRPFADWNFARATVEAGARIFEVKLGGHYPALHETVTQVKNSFWETVTGIRNIRSINMSEGRPFSAFIGVRIPICKENHSSLQEIVGFVVPLGVDRITLSFDDCDLSIGQAMSFVQNAIETSLFNKIWIATEKIPLCLMEGYEHHASETYLSPDGHYEQHEHCRRCVYGSACKGVFKPYLSARGFDEFKPVSESKHAADVGAFRNV